MAEQRNPGTGDERGSTGGNADTANNAESTREAASTGETPGKAAAEPQDPGRSVRSMVGATSLLAVIALVMAGLMGQCSFSPFGPSIDPDSAPSINASAALQNAAKQVKFPVFEPDLPGSWQANSADVRRVPSPSGSTPAGKSVRVGWVTAEMRYVRLTQSNAPEAALVAVETQQLPRAKGIVRAAGQKWVVYQSLRSEVAWVAQRDGVQLLITGDASRSAFRTMAKAVMTAPRVNPQG